jgi:alpha-N-arabinofuranosidase
MYKNPIIPGFASDPSICRAGDDYYLVTSTFEYFPAIALYHSKDLVSWKFIKYVLDRDEQLDLTKIESSQGIFASNIRYNDGLFYVISTCMGGVGHFYVVTDNPRGSWSNPIFVEGIGFDDDIFFDNEGKSYFIRQDNKVGGIVLFFLDIKSGKLLDEGKVIHRGFEDKFCEGPHIYHIGDWYYLMQAEGGTYRGHMETLSRSENLWGPYENCPNNPILTHRNAINSPIQSVGHGDLIQRKDGKWYITFLGTRPINRFHHLGRESFLAPVEFSEDGWFSVNKFKEITLTMNDKTISCNHDDWNVNETFCKGQNSKEFCFRRNQPEGTVRIKDDSLILTKLNDLEPFVFYGIRQRAFDCILKSTIIRNSNSSYSGIMCVMNECHYYALGITIERDKTYCVKLRKVVDDMEMEIKIPVSLKDTYKLKIKATSVEYSFFCDEQLIGTAKTSLLSSEVATGFTGVFLGMFNMDKNTKSKFLDFNYYQ